MLFRGEEYVANKRWCGSTPRYAEPNEVLELFETDLLAIGVVRRGFYTGLAGLGVPCAAVHRHQGRAPGPSYGKGLTREQAMVSAGMEAIERAAAEVYDGPVLKASYRELCTSHPMIRQDQLLLTKQSFFHPHLELEWGLGWDIVNQEEVPVPLDMIIFGGYHRPSSLFTFESTTNGLAAGVVLAEAAVQAVAELVERDGLKLHKFLSIQRNSYFPLRKVKMAAIDHPLVLGVIDACASHGANCTLFDCSVDTQVPIYTAIIYDTSQCPPLIVQGFGASLNPDLAMLRALTEAALAAVENNQGTRQTSGPDMLFMKQVLTYDSYFEALDSMPEIVSPKTWQDCATDTFHGDLDIYIQRMQAVGVERVLLFDMSRPGLKTKVVRAIAPGLEGLHNFNFCRYGKRSALYAKSQLP
ncbi:YcaO-like family protein [Desulfovibrio inopinatus]|uniref:YcaO-like family protein n=1 Tax=Desulfovibrio inopinatus TaxID=102109 RepID=UPI00146F9C78|nr:YcaO-like family protein [Desulfovibrio inopinatus]